MSLEIVAADELGDPVHMAGHDVAAELVPDAQRALEIEPCADPPASRRGDGERLGGGIGGEPGVPILLAGTDHGEADPIAGDRSTIGDAGALIVAGDLEATQIIGAGMHRNHFADVGDDAGEHLCLPSGWTKRGGQ